MGRVTKFSPNDLLNLENAALSSGGASSLSVGGVKIFNAGNNPQNGTVSYRGNGQQFFTTPSGDSAQQVAVSTQGGAGKIKLQKVATENNQSVTSLIGNLTANDWLLIGGAVLVGVIVIFLVK